jgi:putative ABC transport system permease protein
MNTLLQDIKYGVRMLLKDPGFTAVAVLTLALGIGANTAIFSVIDAVLLNRMPYPDAGRLVVVWEQNPGRGWFRNIISASNFLDWRRQNHVFTRMAAISEGSYDVSGKSEPAEVSGEQVSANFFSVLGVRAALGRAFSSDEDQPDGVRVVVLSNGLWKERYGGDPTLLGRTINISRIPYRVIGVMPQGFYFPPWGDRAELWIAGLDLRQPKRDWHDYRSIARLKAGVTMAQAQAEMDTIARRLENQYPEQKGWGVQLVNLHEQVVGDTRPALLVLLAAVGMVLLIACANLANLQLGRVTAREKEIAVRNALGAGRPRVIRQLLTENVVLAVTGGGAGLILAAWGISLLRVLAPENTPGLGQAGVRTGVLAFTLVLSVCTGLAFGLMPALGASRVDLNQSLKESGRGTTAGGQRSNRLRGLLVSAELALALVLLVGAGLLIKTFVNLSQVDLGFDPHQVLAMRIALLGPNYEERSRQAEFFRHLLHEVRSLPGVTSAAVIDGGGLPPDGGNGDSFLIAGRPVPPPNEYPEAVNRVISADYFRTMGIPLVRGRVFTEADNQASPRVVVVNEKLAREHWPGGNPIGSQITFPGIEDLTLPGGAKRQPTQFSIVGVVRGERNLGLEIEPQAEVYLPYSQQPAYYVPRTLVVRTSIDPKSLLSAIRHQVELLDKDQPISDVRTMDEVVAQAEAGHRFPALLLALFAGLALVLAGVGIYGVVSYSVGQRLHELGIRMALGAQRTDVLRLVVGQGLLLILMGVGMGLAAAFGLTRLMSGLLYGVRPTDLATFAVVSLVLAGVAVLASYIPARRAARVDPMVALRYE